VKTQIVKIGNSRGVRIPKPLLDQTGLSGQVEVSVKGDALVISRARKPREGWAEAFEAMADAGEDSLLDADSLQPTRWDREEWEW
jgi:antitoxin MazE